jgi:hypothetical protein
VTPTKTARQLQLIDIENLTGTPRPRPIQVAEAASVWGELVDPRITAQAVIACNHGAAEAVCFGWDPSARRLLRSGPDGADLALIEVLTTEGVEHRYTEVVIGSGDGVFAEPVARLAAAGLHVTVIAPRLGLSRRLRLAAHTVIPFERPLAVVAAYEIVRAA